MKEPIAPHSWSAVRTVFNAAFRSSFHYSIASVDADGAPHATPIGSVLLGEPGRAVYFEIFTAHLPRNVRANDRVCLLAVDSTRAFWLRALLRGRFPRPPGVRLHGRVVGERRKPTEAELARWRKRLGLLRWTKGYDLLWKRLDHVRDVEIDAFEWIRLGKM